MRTVSPHAGQAKDSPHSDHLGSSLFHNTNLTSSSRHTSPNPTSQNSRQSSPNDSGNRNSWASSTSDASDDFEDWEEEDPVTARDMPSDLRPPYHRPTDGRSDAPLLGSKAENGYASGRPSVSRRRSTFHERDPDFEAKQATRRRYTYAAFFLAVSLVSFTIQTETAVYIKKHLKWSKSYAML